MMKRREFFGHTLAAGAALGGRLQAAAPGQDLRSWERIVPSKEDELTTNGYPWISGNTFKMGQVVFERAAPRKPHAGKVLAAIQPHSDDIPLFSAGTVAKLMKEGKKLPLLGNNDETANREYIKQLVLYNDKVVGEQYGVEYAEKFHYIGPSQSSIDKYVSENSVPL